MNEKEYNKQVKTIRRMPYSSENLKAIMALETHVQRLNDKSILRNHKYITLEYAIFTGDIDIAMSNFSWYLKNLPDEPNHWIIMNVGISYKWIINSCIATTYFSNEKINQLLDDYQSFLKKHNFSFEPYYKLVFINNLKNHNRSKLRDNYITWREQEHCVVLSDCEACTLAEIITYYAQIGNFNKVKKEIIPIDKGHLKCKEIPHFLYPELGFLLAIAGKTSDSLHYYHLGQELIADLKSHLQPISYSILCSSIHELNNTNVLVNQYSHLEFEAKIHYDLLIYYVAMTIYLYRLSAISSTVSLKLPKVHPLHDESKIYNCENLLDYYQNKAKMMMEAFDQRNENNNVSKYYEELIITAKNLPINVEA